MRTIYLDLDSRCHVTDDGTMTAVETDYFDGKCDTYVEGYCYDAEGGVIYPWVEHSELDGTQKQYERMMAEAEAAYQEGVNEA